MIQPHLPIRLPCYDFTPVIAPTLDGCFLAVSPPASGVNDFRGVTGGVYKARERIHRSMLTCDYYLQSELGGVFWDSLRIAPSLPSVRPIVVRV